MADWSSTHPEIASKTPAQLYHNSKRKSKTPDAFTYSKNTGNGEPSVISSGVTLHP